MIGIFVEGPLVKLHRFLVQGLGLQLPARGFKVISSAARSLI